MNITPLVLAATLALVAPFARAQDTLAQDALARAMQGTAAPGMAILEMHDGRVVREAVRGVRRNDWPDLARSEDAWQIGCDAKPMTAALIARLVDPKVLAWTTPLSTLLPALAATMRPEYRQVTLLQLLSHHAGLPNDASDEAFFATFFHDTRPLPEQRLASLAKAVAEAPVARPRTRFEYSNTGAKLEDTNPAMFAPAGNMAMSLRDWSAFCVDQMAGAHDHGQLLSKQAYHRMQQAQPGGGNVGLGWGLQAALAGHAGLVLLHAGSDGTGDALVALFPKTQPGLLVVANASDEMGGAKATRDAMVAMMKDYP